MNKEIYIKQISDNLGILRHQVELRNSLQLYDINILAEDFFKDLLNLVYGYQLENLNITDAQKTAIDLGDKKARAAVQVTSENSSAKIRDTVDKFNARKLYQEYNHLIILIITKKKKYSENFRNRSLFFKTEILDISDLLRHIRGLETPGLEKIADFLEKEFEVKGKQGGKAAGLSEPNEVATIMSLIEFLSNYESKNIDDEVEEEPDPEDKVYRRFSDHSEFLISQYQELVAMYGEALKIAAKTLGLNPGKIKKVRLYLKDESDKVLTKCDDNPKKALEVLIEYFESKISTSGIRYDRVAIKFYLVDELIKCNVFPNPPGEKR
jgi:hypothetical protein